MEEAIKFVWAYMIEQGRVTDGKWNYYAGDWQDAYQNNYDFVARAKTMDAVRKKVKEIGIDWKKTQTPTSSMESSFEGTDNDSSSVESLIGILVLKDGSEYMIGMGNSDVRFSVYIDTMKTLMQDKQRVKDILGE